MTPACFHHHHRWSDWHLADSARVVCGVCYPPADGIAAIGIDGELVEPELRASHQQAVGRA